MPQNKLIMIFGMTALLMPLAMVQAATFAGELTWVKCSRDSIHGKIVSNWKRDGSKLTMEVTIPLYGSTDFLPHTSRTDLEV